MCPKSLLLGRERGETDPTMTSIEYDLDTSGGLMDVSLNSIKWRILPLSLFDAMVFSKSKPLLRPHNLKKSKRENRQLNIRTLSDLVKGITTTVVMHVVKEEI